jgi:hypothetical protein
MKKLNKAGVTKVLNYLGKAISEDKMSFNVNDVAEMAKIGVIHHNNNLYYINEEDDIKRGVEKPISAGEDNERDDLLLKMLPRLREIFPTKDEVNAALNKLKSTGIDPDEVVDGLEGQIEFIKKQSRSTDKIG